MNIDIPLELPETQSWFFMPLIIDALCDTKVKVIWPFDMGKLIFELQNTKVGKFIPIDDYVTMKNKIRNSLLSHGITNFQSLNIHCDKIFHLPGDLQMDILYSIKDFDVILSLVTYEVITKHALEVIVIL
jgi:hypothetical protein